MSEYQDFYMNWLGCEAFGGNKFKVKEIPTAPFSPLDISGLAIWLDANNNFAVQVNNLLQVQSWQNEGYLGGQFDLSDGIIEYGQHPVNGLNTVTFQENAFMSGQFQLDFQARSVFIVAREKTDLSGANPWITSDTNDGMETFSLRGSGTTTYFIGKHPSPIPELAFDSTVDYLNYASLTEFINGADLSDNWFGINGLKYPATYEAVASGYNTNLITYYLGGYFNSSPVASAEDFCEIIIYDTALSESDRLQVEYYLKQKWGIVEPPLNPSSIANLSVWLDAADTATITDSSNDITSWFNKGDLSGSFVPYPGEASPTTNTRLIGGVNAVWFDSYQSLYQNLTFTNQAYTVFVVTNTISDLSSNNYADWFGGYVTTALNTGLSYDSGYYYTGAGCNAIDNTVLMQDTTYPQNTPVIYSIRTSSTLATNEIRINNVTQTLLVNQDFGYLTSGADYFVHSYTHASSLVLGELLVFNRALTDTEVLQVTNYLSDKWSITI